MKYRWKPVLPVLLTAITLTGCGSRMSSSDNMNDSAADRRGITDAEDVTMSSTEDGVLEGIVSDVAEDGREIVSDAAEGVRDLFDDAAETTARYDKPETGGTRDTRNSR